MQATQPVLTTLRGPLALVSKTVQQTAQTIEQPTQTVWQCTGLRRAAGDFPNAASQLPSSTVKC